ncbi:MAG: flagellar biosynthetic protein FliO [Lachnospiraceae bacterium]|nr:flagellar biosynthetic protein FliO [Lachnospiraceae bacterium]
MISVVLISGTVEGFAQFMTVLIIFAIVLALTYFTTRFVGSYQKLQGLNRNLEILETLKVTNNKFLQIIRAGNKYFVIAVNKDDISLISELSGEELDMSVNDQKTEDRFKKMLDIARDKMTKRGDKQ